MEVCKIRKLAFKNFKTKWFWKSRKPVVCPISCTSSRVG